MLPDGVRGAQPRNAERSAEDIALSRVLVLWGAQDWWAGDWWSWWAMGLVSKAGEAVVGAVGAGEAGGTGGVGDWWG